MALTADSIRMDCPVKCVFGKAVEWTCAYYSPASMSRSGPWAWVIPTASLAEGELNMQESISDKIRDAVPSLPHSDWSFYDKELFCMQMGLYSKDAIGS